MFFVATFQMRIKTSSIKMAFGCMARTDITRWINKSGSRSFPDRRSGLYANTDIKYHKFQSTTEFLAFCDFRV